MGSILWDQLCSWSCFTVYCFFFIIIFFWSKLSGLDVPLRTHSLYYSFNVPLWLALVTGPYLLLHLSIQGHWTRMVSVLRSKVASHWHYYFDTFKLGRPSGKWKFASVFIFMLLVWQIMYSFAEMHWHSSTHTFDGEFSETETQRDILSLCISSPVFYFDVTWQRFSAEVTAEYFRESQKSSFFLFLRNPVAGNKNHTSLNWKACFYF